MEAEQQEECYRLEAEAVEQLRRGMAHPLSVSLLFQVLVLPAFEPETGWEVCRDNRAADPYFVVRSVWQKEVDLAKLETPVARRQHPIPLVPTIEVRQWPLETAWVEARRIALKNILLPVLVASEMVGCDGTFYEFAFDDVFVKARYRWWEEPPEGWEPLGRWLDETVEVLRRGPV